MSTFEQAAPPPLPGGPTLPRTIGVWWIVLALPVAILLMPALISIPAIVAIGDAESDAAVIAAQIALEISLVTVPFVVCRIERIVPALRRLGLRAFRFWSGIGWAVVAYLAFIAIAAIIGTVLPTDTEQQVLQDIEAEKDTAVLVAQGILIIGLAPLAEEIFFRGFVFGGLRGRLSFWPAAVISGVIFGSIHIVGGSLVAVLQLSVLGIALGWLYERTGSIWPGVIVHVLQNTLAFTVTVA